jgi:anhydro-N-acetylmuramic acid kinase
LSGKKIIWDFRTSDIANGGEGAPLSPFFHFACTKLLDLQETVAFVNLGGVGNISVVSKNTKTPEEKNSLIAFDTGPANAPINDFVFSRLGLLYDKNGDLAHRGNVDKRILNNFLNLDFFNRKPPKSLDRNDFSFLSDLVSNLSDEDGAATLTAICIETICLSLTHLPNKPSKWLICGGGRNNRTIIKGLQKRLDAPVLTVEEIGLDGDMLEAQAFGYLAARVVKNLPLSSPTTTGCKSPTIGGRISHP